MVLILKKAWQGYQYAFRELIDPRTEPWFLVARPYQVFSLVAIYLMFSLKWGPEWMKKRKAFNVDKLLIAYNIFQIFACGYIFYKALVLAWLWDYKWFCEPVDFSHNERPLEIARTTYYYFLLKVIDLLDTVFFVLRKKFNQVSFLHVYHHGGMVLIIWGAVTYLPGGHGTFIGLVNSFVHVVMYSYYLLTVAKPRFKNAIWLKKCITQIQILQFLSFVIHMGAIIFKDDCAYPRFTSGVFLPQNLFMLFLFIDFYIKTYIRKPKEKIQMKKIENNENKADEIELENVYNKNGVHKRKQINYDFSETVANGKSTNGFGPAYSNNSETHR